MTDVQDEVPMDAEDVQAPPAPAPSDGSAEAGSPGTDIAALEGRIAGIEEAIEKLPDMVDARFKHTKDSSVAGLVNRVDEIVSWVEKSGGDASKITPDLRMAQLETEIAALKESGGAVGTAPATGTQAEKTNVAVSTDILGRYQIEPDNPEYLQFVAHSPPQGAQSWELTLEGWAQKHTNKAVKASSITPAAAVGESGAAPSTTGQEEALTQELQDYYAGTHGSLSLPENNKRMKEISAELDKLSPPVIP